MKIQSVLSLLLLAAATASAQRLTPEQTLNRRGIGDLEFSPDGARLVFTVTDPPKGATRPRHLWLLDVGSGLIRPLTTVEGKSDSSPRWSPDGRFIAFLGNREADRDAEQHLYVLPMAGGEAERLVDAKEAVVAFQWSPEGRQIAFLMAEPKPAALERREKDRDDRRVVDRDERRSRIWVVDAVSRTVRQVTSGTWRIAQIEWMPGGADLVASATDTPQSDRWTDRIFSVSLADGRFTPIAAPRGPLGAFAVAPDGGAFAYVGARVDGPEPHDLWIKKLEGAPYNLTGTTSSNAAFDRPVRQPRWIDGSTVMAIADAGFHSQVVSLAITGAVQTITSDDATVSAFARSPSGAVAYVSETAIRPAELWLKPPNGSAAKITAFNEQWTSIRLAAPEIVHYKSFDGATIEAALLTPGGAGSARDDSARPNGARVPLVVLVHGGPTGRWSDTFEPWGQLLASRGYAVLYPNIRGSTGYGQRFVEMNRANWGGGDFKDVMAGVDWAIARGVADPDRLAIGGWSYGGYMAAWAVTQTTRFKAAVSGAPVIDIASEFGTEGGSAYDEWFYGLPYEKLDGFIKGSPITYVKQVRTPTLLLQGEDDVTDPIGQSQQFYRGLKQYGVEADLVLYPREGHGLREEKHLVDRLTRIIEWYDKYLKPPRPATQQ